MKTEEQKQFVNSRGRAKGYKMTEEQKLARRNYRHTPEAIEKIRKSRLGKKASKETREKLRKLKLGVPNINGRGERHYRWKGGITKTNLAIRQSIEYKIWHRAVFERDNWTCVWCGRRSKSGSPVELHADHIKPFALFPELRFAIDNGRTLCKECHETTDTYKRKTNDSKR